MKSIDKAVKFKRDNDNVYDGFLSIKMKRRGK